MVIAYAEEHGSPNESWTDTGVNATRVLRCDWADRHDNVTYFLGRNYPYIDENVVKDIKCIRAGIAPAPGKQLGAGIYTAYDHALITLEYESGQPVDDLSETIEANAEFITSPIAGLKWASTGGDAVTTAEAPGMLLRGFDYVITRYKRTEIPLGILELHGAVNSSTITPRTQGLTHLNFPPETLLFQPPTISRVTTTTEWGLWDITYRFSYRPSWNGTDAKGWNWFWRAKTQKFEKMIREETGTQFKLYQPKDFNFVFLN